MGAVWLAEHETLGTEVVVKFLAKSLHEDAQSRERFSREAAAAAKVRSPHVVQTFDHGILPSGTPFIVMEYLDGQDLGQVLRQRRLNVEQVASVIEQVSRALDASHQRGIIHRDIKPANIFLVDVGAKNPFVKLLDFGVAKTTAAMTLTSTGEVVGTPVYMSPEQIAGQELDHRADLWSLGIVAFRCLTGRRPFDGESVAEVAYKVVHAPMPRVLELEPSLPPTVDRWFERACARNRGHRFSSAREMADAFWEAVGLPEGASSASGDSHHRLMAAHVPTVVDRSAAPERTAGSLRSSVATVTPVAPSRPWALAFAFGLPTALVIGFLAARAMMETPTSEAAASQSTEQAPPDVDELAPSVVVPSASASATASASVSASASAPASATASATVPSRPSRPRPVAPRPEPVDDLGF